MPDPSIRYSPTSLRGTQGTGVRQFISADGDIQAIPNRRTPPYGEPDLYAETVELPYPVDPPINTGYEDELLHEQMHGVPWHGYRIQEWQNPSNPGVPNLGPVNDQPFVSGHSQITVPNPAAEQGWGMDPAVLLPRFPHSENVFPGYSAGRYRRNGQLEFSASGLPFGALTQQHVQALTARTRQRSSVHVRLADNPQPVPYSSTITPVGGQAGPMALYAVLPYEDEGIY
jgi:hypothetical protein